MARADWMYKGSYDLPTEEPKRLHVLKEMYRLAHYWSLVDSDLFNSLTRQLIQSIGTQTYSSCASCWTPPLNPPTNCMIRVVRELAEGLSLEDGPLAKKCEEFERKNRSVLAENR